MVFGLEREALRKKFRRQELKVGGVKILSSSLGMIRMDRIRDEYIRGTAHVSMCWMCTVEGQWMYH